MKRGSGDSKGQHSVFKGVSRAVLGVKWSKPVAQALGSELRTGAPVLGCAAQETPAPHFRTKEQGVYKRRQGQGCLPASQDEEGLWEGGSLRTPAPQDVGVRVRGPALASWRPCCPHPICSRECSLSGDTEGVFLFLNIPFLFTLGSHPGNSFPVSSLWKERDGMREGPQECFLSVKVIFMSCCHFSGVIPVRRLLSSLTHPSSVSWK